MAMWVVVKDERPTWIFVGLGEFSRGVFSIVMACHEAARGILDKNGALDLDFCRALNFFDF